MGKQVDLAVYNEWTYAVKGRAMERHLNLRAMLAEFVGKSLASRILEPRVRWISTAPAVWNAFVSFVLIYSCTVHAWNLGFAPVFPLSRRPSRVSSPPPPSLHLPQA